MTRATKTASTESLRHLVEAFVDYAETVVTQAEDRDKDTYRTVEAYIQHRRENTGARPTYALSELHLNIPDYAFYHPVVQELTYHITDLVMLDNVSWRYKSLSNEDEKY